MYRYTFALTLVPEPADEDTSQYATSDPPELRTATTALNNEIAKQLPTVIEAPICRSTKTHEATILQGVGAMTLHPLLLDAFETLTNSTLPRQIPYSSRCVLSLGDNVCRICNTPPLPCHIMDGFLCEHHPKSKKSAVAKWTPFTNRFFWLKVEYRFRDPNGSHQ